LGSEQDTGARTSAGISSAPICTHQVWTADQLCQHPHHLNFRSPASRILPSFLPLPPRPPGGATPPPAPWLVGVYLGGVVAQVYLTGLLLMWRPGPGQLVMVEAGVALQQVSLRVCVCVGGGGGG
jgi:hypothetical protein